MMLGGFILTLLLIVHSNISRMDCFKPIKQKEKKNTEKPNESHTHNTFMSRTSAVYGR